MGRLKEYDLEVVLDKAANVFWAKSFEATSMSELVEATGLNSASMYKEFGSKEGLFERTLEHFRANYLEPLIHPLAENPGLEALENFLEQVSVSAQSPYFKGCLMMNTVSDVNIVGPEIMKSVEKYCLKLETVLEGAIRTAQRDGDIPAGKDAVVLAHYVVCFIQGLTSYGRIQDHKPYIGSLIEQVKDYLRK